MSWVFKSCTIVRVEVVVDVSALLAAVLGEPERESILEATHGTVLIGPAVVPFEIANALTALWKRGRVGNDSILPAWESARKIPVQLVPVDVEATIVLAMEHEIYAYDAFYLQCAISHRRPLLTLDRRMRRTAEELGVKLVI